LIARTPATKLETDTKPAHLGEMVLKSLSGIPEQEVQVDLSASQRDYLSHLQELGFKSIRAFAKGSSLVSATLEGDTVELVPHASSSRGAFTPLAEKARQCPAEAHALGVAAIELRRICS